LSSVRTAAADGWRLVEIYPEDMRHHVLCHLYCEDVLLLVRSCKAVRPTEFGLQAHPP